MAQERNEVSLAQLVEGKLPKRIRRSINDMSLTVEEMLEWVESKSPSHISVTKEAVTIKLYLRIPTKKLLIVLAGGGGLSGVLLLLKTLLIG
jgi:hypothetical protein